jgi:hypothetical protein
MREEAERSDAYPADVNLSVSSSPCIDIGGGRSSPAHGALFGTGGIEYGKVAIRRGIMRPANSFAVFRGRRATPRFPGGSRCFLSLLLF